jgi:hypothetical protein
MQKRLVDLYVQFYEKNNKVQNLTYENLQKIVQLQNRHAGKRCFIVGGSPSLRSLDLTRLSSEIVFTTNRGFQLARHGLMHTAYHVMSDSFTFLADNVCDEIPPDFADTFLIYGGVKFTPKVKNIIYFDYEPGKTTGFQKDLQGPLIPAASLICLSIQIACYMGFAKIYLIGVDLDFVHNPGHAYEQTEGEKTRQDRTIESKPIILNWLKEAAYLLQKEGRELYNASPVGEVNCIPRANYESLL